MSKESDKETPSYSRLIKASLNKSQEKEASNGASDKSVGISKAQNNKRQQTLKNEQIQQGEKDTPKRPKTKEDTKKKLSKEIKTLAEQYEELQKEHIRELSKYNVYAEKFPDQREEYLDLAEKHSIQAEEMKLALEAEIEREKDRDKRMLKLRHAGVKEIIKEDTLSQKLSIRERLANRAKRRLNKSSQESSRLLEDSILDLSNISNSEIQNEVEGNTSSRRSTERVTPIQPLAESNLNLDHLGISEQNLSSNRSGERSSDQPQVRAQIYESSEYSSDGLDKSFASENIVPKKDLYEQQKEVKQKFENFQNNIGNLQNEAANLEDDIQQQESYIKNIRPLIENAHQELIKNEKSISSQATGLQEEKERILENAKIKTNLAIEDIYKEEIRELKEDAVRIRKEIEKLAKDDYRKNLYVEELKESFLEYLGGIEKDAKLVKSISEERDKQKDAVGSDKYTFGEKEEGNKKLLNEVQELKKSFNNLKLNGFREDITVPKNFLENGNLPAKALVLKGKSNKLLEKMESCRKSIQEQYDEFGYNVKSGKDGVSTSPLTSQGVALDFNKKLSSKSNVSLQNLEILQKKEDELEKKISDLEIERENVKNHVNDTSYIGGDISNVQSIGEGIMQNSSVKERLSKRSDIGDRCTSELNEVNLQLSYLDAHNETIKVQEDHNQLLSNLDEELERKEVTFKQAKEKLETTKKAIDVAKKEHDGFRKSIELLGEFAKEPERQNIKKELKEFAINEEDFQFLDNLVNNISYINKERIEIQEFNNILNEDIEGKNNVIEQQNKEIVEQKELTSILQERQRSGDAEIIKKQIQKGGRSLQDELAEWS